MVKYLLLILLFILPATSWAAQECTYAEAETISQKFTGALNDVSKNAILSAAKDCLLSVLDGVWNATGGLAESAWDCITSPIDCAESGIESIKGAYHFITNLSSELNKMWTSLKEIPGDELADFICGIVGELGTDVLLGILTAGAGSAKLALTISKVTMKIAKIAKILGKLSGVSLKVLREVSDSVLDQLQKIVNKGDKALLRRQLKGAGCAIR